MNGFTNAILSLLLGWLRSLFNAVWALLGSDHSGALVNLLRDHWKIIFLVMCVGGFVVDRLIYLIRWRPYYVWRSKHKRHAGNGEDNAYAPQAPSPYHRGYTAPYTPHYPAEPELFEDTTYPDDTIYYPPQETASYAPTYRYPAQPQNGGYAPAAYDQPTPSRYATPAYPAQASYANGKLQPGDTTVFSRDATFAPTVSFQALPYQAPVEPEPFTDDPRFDDDPAYWNAPQSVSDDFAQRLAPERNPAQGMRPVFGSSQPEPLQYLQDVQAGFAPPPQPEQLYAQRSETPAEPVHPGLDIETFHQNIGLTDPSALDDSAHRDAESFPNFAPFPVANQTDGVEAKPRGLSALAKKARSFVSGDDERNPRSIRDLQPTVDVKNAFHEPVYPKKKSESEEE